MLSCHDLIITRRGSLDHLNIMGGNRQNGAAEDARGINSFTDKYPSRNVSPGAVARVRRNLFGSSAMSTKKFLDNELSKLKTSQNEKWNFDFGSGKPLNNPNGKYIWERVGGGGSPMKKSASCPVQQKLVQKKLTDFMCKRKISPVSQDKSKTFKKEAGGHSSTAGKTFAN